MQLTLQQKKEVQDYISASSKYRETYNEIYDHLLNALEEIEEPYQLKLVGRIVLQDFGSFKEIKKMEKDSLSKTKYRCIRYLVADMISVFKFQNLIYTLLLLIFYASLYVYQLGNGVNFANLYLWSMILGYTLSVAWLFKKGYINLSFRRKSSMEGVILGWLILLPFSFFPLTFTAFIGKGNMIGLALNTRNIIVLCLFFFTSMYLKAFVKLYKKKVRRLA